MAAAGNQLQFEFDEKAPASPELFLFQPTKSRALKCSARCGSAVRARRFHTYEVGAFASGIQFHIFNRLFNRAVHRRNRALHFADLRAFRRRIFTRNSYILRFGNDRLARAARECCRERESRNRQSGNQLRQRLVRRHIPLSFVGRFKHLFVEHGKPKNHRRRAQALASRAPLCRSQRAPCLWPSLCSD